MIDDNSIACMDYENLDREIKRTMRRSASDAVRLGYLLRKMYDGQLWMERYDCLDEYLQRELHMDYSMATRFMNINKKYSVGGDSEEIADNWTGFSQSVLIEMLNMPPELAVMVTPDMSVRQVQEVKRQARREKQKGKAGDGETPQQLEAVEAEAAAPPVQAFAEPDGNAARYLDTFAERFVCSSLDWMQESSWGEVEDAELIPEEVKRHLVKHVRWWDFRVEDVIVNIKLYSEYVQLLDEKGDSLGRFDWSYLAAAIRSRYYAATERMAREDPGTAQQEEIPDAEYRELEPAEEVATSQPERSAYGLEKTVYPEESLIAEFGCGHKYNCFSCAQDCGIRQKYRYCMYAPLGNPFGCDTMEALEEIKAEVGERCQFINNDLAGHKAGTGEADPCCTNCTEDCRYRCQRSRKEIDTVPQEDAAEDVSGPEPEVNSESGTAPQMAAGSACEEQDGGIVDRLAEVRQILENERKTLSDYLEVAAKENFPQKLMFKQQTMVAALAEMVRSMEEAEAAEPAPEPREQPPLPLLKNNDQRREWLKSYKDWGLWYRDDNIGVDYYKYDFENGARLVVEVYQEVATRYYEAHESSFLHLIGGPDPMKGQHGICKWQRHEKYSRYPNSETEMIEFLKELQRKGGTTQ